MSAKVKQACVSAQAPRTGWSAVLLALAVFSAATGCNSPQPESSRPVPDHHDDGEWARVTGIGGVFFKSDDPKGVLQWYRTHLGITSADWGGFAFQWKEKDRPDETGYTVWGAFPDTTPYFAPSDQPFMVNFRVADLGRLIEALRVEGVEIVGEIEQHPNGKFAWILDPEGRKVELWEPVASADDPYLK